VATLAMPATPEMLMAPRMEEQEAVGIAAAMAVAVVVGDKCAFSLGRDSQQPSGRTPSRELSLLD